MKTLNDCLGELRHRKLLPDSCVAAFAAGSVVLGWDNSASDLDLYVICGEPWRSRSATVRTVALRPDSISADMTYVDGRRWDIEYWLDSQVEQLITKVSWQNYDLKGSPAELTTWLEIDFLERLAYGAPVLNEDWLAQCRKEVEASAFRSIVVSRFLRLLESLLEDATGQLAAGDLESAVLSARQAFGCAVDALLGREDQASQFQKWRARRVRQSSQRILTFDEYWAVETMRTFDPADPGAWVTDVVLLCQSISREVAV